MLSRKRILLLLLASTLVLTAGAIELVRIARSASAQSAASGSTARKSDLEVEKSRTGKSRSNLPGSTVPESAIPGIVNSDTIRAAAVGKTINGIHVAVDPRIELLAMVQLISDYNDKYGLITRFNTKYKENMRRHFEHYSDHPAVKLFESMSHAAFSYDAPPAFVLYLSDPPGLVRARDFSPYLMRRAGGVTTLEKFTEELRHFAEDTDFTQFYLANQPYYNEMIEKNCKYLEKDSYISDMEEYYGTKQNSYNIILAPLFTGGFGPQLANPDGKNDIYNIMGPMDVENGIPIFGDKTGFELMIWHEFGHSFVNPVMERKQAELSKYGKLYVPLETEMKKQAYQDWITCVCEHVDRAVTCRLIRKSEGKEAYDNMVNSEKSKGFYYIDALLEALQVYEGNRDKYACFDDFSTEIVKVFEELSQKDLGEDFYSIPFSGPINAATFSDKPIFIVVPTGEKSDPAEKSIGKYAKTIASMLEKRYEKTIEVITDEQALQSDLTGKTIFAYGTMEGNLWLKKYSGTFPFRIEKDKILADKEYAGSDLRFISALPNPVDRKNALVIYTSQRAEAIPNINNIFHGPTDFLIAEGAKEIRSGNYDKSGDEWKFIPEQAD